MEPIPPRSFRPPSMDARREKLHPLDWAHAAGTADLVEREMHASLRRRARRRAAGLGGLAVVCVVAGVFWFARIAPPPNPPASAPLFVTAPSHQVLPDGSRVELNGRATISVEFTADLRRVVLRAGEAHFQVAKNPDRPFVVEANGVEVRAVGTAFTVSSATSGVDVIVTEGRVAVAALTVETGPTPPVFVDAGQRLELGTAAEARARSVARRIEPGELNDRLAWRVPRLELNFTPLSEVLPVVNLHAGVRLVLGAPELGALKLTGNLRANNLPVLLAILDSSFDLTADHRADGTIVLRRR